MPHQQYIQLFEGYAVTYDAMMLHCTINMLSARHPIRILQWTNEYSIRRQRKCFLNCKAAAASFFACLLYFTGTRR